MKANRAWSRREFVGTAAAGLVAARVPARAAEPPPETKRCYELRAAKDLRALRELKGGTVVVANFGRKPSSRSSSRAIRSRQDARCAPAQGRGHLRRPARAGTDWRFVEQLRKELKS